MGGSALAADGIRLICLANEVVRVGIGSAVAAGTAAGPETS
jgi:hypothetical protein